MEPVEARHLEEKLEKPSEDETKTQLSSTSACPDVDSSQKVQQSSLVSDSGHTGIPEKPGSEHSEEQKHPESEKTSSPAAPALPGSSDHVSVETENLGLAGPGGPGSLAEPVPNDAKLEEVSEVLHIAGSLPSKPDVVESPSNVVEQKEEGKVGLSENPSIKVENKEEVKGELVPSYLDWNLEEPKITGLEEQFDEFHIATTTAILQPGEKIEEQQVDDLPAPPPVLFREPSANDPEAPDSQHSYFQELGHYRVQMSDWVEANTSTYIYDDLPLSPEGLSRINKEIKALTRALPCEPSGAVFIHLDSSNLSRIKVLISGTEDTPYEHGLYLFDIKLDSSYPNSPPKMTIKTTGNGTLRFNPNLYDSGYVCLSIINTWGGDPEEMWNPSYSTLMQVFLSIQALVMNNDVIQKEPGYEGMATNCPENRDYMTIVKYGNIKYAMIDMISNPPEEFKEIVLKHFSLKKDKILESVQKWMDDLENIGQGFGDCIVSSHNYNAISALSETEPKKIFEGLLIQLKEKLESLPSV